MKESMIETIQLTKSFGNLCALDHLDWNVPAGSICGLLGPNGAGKTTTLKIFLGMTQPSSGTAIIHHCDIVKDSLAVRKIAAFVPEDKLAYDSMRVDDYLKFYGSFFPDWSNQACQSLTTKWHVPLNQKMRTLSKGIRAKILFIAAIARKAQILILDEPTDGLDPAGTEELLTMLTSWVSNGENTAVIATHRLDEVERICDRIAILNHGKLELSGDLDDLRSNWKYIDITGNVSDEAISGWKEIHRFERTSGGMRVITRSNPREAAARLQKLADSPVNIFDMNLREIYLACIQSQGGIHDSLENLV